MGSSFSFVGFVLKHLFLVPSTRIDRQGCLLARYCCRWQLVSIRRHESPYTLCLIYQKKIELLNNQCYRGKNVSISSSPYGSFWKICFTKLYLHLVFKNIAIWHWFWTSSLTQFTNIFNNYYYQVAAAPPQCFPRRGTRAYYRSGGTTQSVVCGEPWLSCDAC